MAERADGLRGASVRAQGYGNLTLNLTQPLLALTLPCGHPSPDSGEGLVSKLVRFLRQAYQNREGSSRGLRLGSLCEEFQVWDCISRVARFFHFHNPERLLFGYNGLT